MITPKHSNFNVFIYVHLKAGHFITDNQIAQNDASRFMLQLQYKFDYPF